MSTKLYVGNLSYDVTNEQLSELFSQAGEVTSANVIMNKFTGRSKGFGFVEFKSEADAKKAIEMYHEKDFQGRKMIVNEARPMRDRNSMTN
jgi:RNA recognition motif-containing protein